MNDDELTFDRLLRSTRVIAQRWIVVVVSGALLAAIAYGYSKAQRNEYQATASLLFRDPQFDQKLFGSTFFQPSQDPDREALTNSTLVGFDVVAQQAVRALRTNLTTDQLRAKVDIASKGRSDVVDVTANDASPRTAVAIANAWATAFITVRRNADRGKIAQAEQLIKNTIAHLPNTLAAAEQRRSLADRQQELQILASLQTGNAELAQPAELPEHPSSPKPLRSGLIGGFLGILLGAFIALVLGRLDRRVKSTEEARLIFDRPLLGVVPASPTIASRQKTNESPRDTETFRMLRTNLQYFNVDQEVRSVLVTSAAAGDGKSTIALHLALASARSGTSTLLVECDLRRPSLGKTLGHDQTSGLTQFLAGGVSFAGATMSIPASAGVEGMRAPTILDVALAGPIPPNPADLLESQRMLEFLTLAEEKYDLVVIDSSPALVVSDSVPLLSRASGVIVAVRLGKTTREECEALHARLGNLNVEPLGIVVNDVKMDGDRYGYYYTAEPPEPATPGSRKSKAATKA